MADLAGHLRGDDPSEIIKFPPLSKLFVPVWNPDFYQVRLSLTAVCLGPYSVPLRQGGQEKHKARLHTVRQATAGKHRRYILGLYTK